MKYLWPILLAIYIISPFDAHPLFLDDLIASGVLFYMLYKNAQRKKQEHQYDNYYRQSQSSGGSQNRDEAGPKGPLTLDQSYRLLGVSAQATMEEITSAYREKIIKSHPDKVSHLSDELQQKAKELTLDLNEAYSLIKKYRQ